MQVTGTFTPKEIKNLESKMRNIGKSDFKKSTPVLGIDSKAKEMEIEKIADPLPVPPQDEAVSKENRVVDRLPIPGIGEYSVKYYGGGIWEGAILTPNSANLDAFYP